MTNGWDRGWVVPDPHELWAANATAGSQWATSFTLTNDDGTLMDITTKTFEFVIRPSVTVTAAPRERRRPLVAAAHAVHQWACRRRGRTAVGCAHLDCPWPGLYRHQHEIPGDDGTWRLFFCSRRHRRAWAAGNGIVLNDRGVAG